jgi:hypothetical protein
MSMGRRKTLTAIPPAPRFGVFQAFFSQEAFLKSLIGFALISFALAAPSLAQTLVDPSKVAPEYREAAEKRRAEQIRQRDCAKKADAGKVMARERTTFLLHCLDEMSAASAGSTTPAAAVIVPAHSPGETATAH